MEEPVRWLSGYNTWNASPETQVQPPEPRKGEKTGLTLQSCLTWTYSYSVRVPIHTIIRKKEVCKEEGREEKREEEKWGEHSGDISLYSPAAIWKCPPRHGKGRE